jgi:predicted aconitase with swiveling domain
MKRVVLRGHFAAKGAAEGEALVTQDMMCFLTDVDVKTGVVTDPTAKLIGQSVAGKIMVFPIARGATADAWGIYMLRKSGAGPKAMINAEANPATVAGAILAGIPMVYHLDKNPLEVIETGDFVQVDSSQGTVVVTKRE